jgi:hypothetical protein
MRPARRFQSSLRQRWVMRCLHGSPASTAQIKTLVSTKKTFGVMDLFAGQVFAVGVEEWLATQGPFHGAFVGVLLHHSLAKQRPQQTGDADIFAGRFDTRPQGHVLLKGHGDVLEIALRNTGST